MSEQCKAKNTKGDRCVNPVFIDDVLGDYPEFCLSHKYPAPPSAASVEPEAQLKRLLERLAISLESIAGACDDGGDLGGYAVGYRKAANVLRNEKGTGVWFDLLNILTPAEGEPVASVIIKQEDDGTSYDLVWITPHGTDLPPGTYHFYTYPAEPEGARENFRQHLENALSWEGRLNEAEQLSMQGHRKDAVPMRLEVQTEMKAARKALK